MPPRVHRAAPSCSIVPRPRVVAQRFIFHCNMQYSAQLQYNWPWMRQALHDGIMHGVARSAACSRPCIISVARHQPLLCPLHRFLRLERYRYFGDGPVSKQLECDLCSITLRSLIRDIIFILIQSNAKYKCEGDVPYIDLETYGRHSLGEFYHQSYLFPGRER